MNDEVPTGDASASLADLIAPELDLYSTAALAHIADTLGLPLPGNRRGLLVATLSQFIGTSAHHDVLRRRLSADQWGTLNLLPLRLGEVPLRSLVAVLRDRGFEGRAALDELSVLLAHAALLPVGPVSYSRMGIDVAHRDFGGRGSSFETAPGVAALASTYDPSPIRLSPVDPPAAVLGSAVLDLQRAVFVVLAEAGRKALKLTNAGPPYKSDLTRLAKALTAAGGSRSAGGGVGADLNAIPPLLWLAIAVCEDVGLLQEVGGSLEPHADMQDFLGDSLEGQIATLFQAWLTCAFNDFAHIPTLTSYYQHAARDPWLNRMDEGSVSDLHRENLASARNLLCAMIVVGLRDASDAWYSLDELTDLVQRNAPELLFPRAPDYQLFLGHLYPAYRSAARAQYPGIVRQLGRPPTSVAEYTLYLDTDWKEVEGAFIRQVVVESLRWLGVIEVERPPTPDGRSERFHLTDLGRAVLLREALEAATPTPTTGRVLIQPNFDVVVVDAANNWKLLSQLDVFAERQTLDRAATYRLTQAGLVRGLTAGWSGQQVLETLESAAGAPLPQNVRYSLQDWAHRYESLTVRETATLLEADSAGQLDAWAADAGIAPLLGRRLGPTTVLVPVRYRNRLVARIAPRGRTLPTVSYSQSLPRILTIRDPDSIELPAPVDPYMRYRLTALGTQIDERDGVATYRITRDSVARAGGMGWSGSQLVELLAETSQNRVPPDVAIRLYGWSGATRPLGAETLVAVVLRSEVPSWDDLCQVKAIGRLVHALPAPTLALVSPSSLDELRSELAARGLGLEEGPIGTEIDVRDRKRALRRALQAFGDPMQALQELAAEGIIKLPYYPGRR